MPRTRAGTIHQGEGSEGRNLQVLSHLEALTKLLKLSGIVLAWTFFPMEDDSLKNAAEWAFIHNYFFPQGFIKLS